MSSSNCCINSTGFSVIPLAGSEIAAAKLSTPICIIVTPLHRNEPAAQVNRDTASRARHAPHGTIWNECVSRLLRALHENSREMLFIADGQDSPKDRHHDSHRQAGRP